METASLTSEDRALVEQVGETNSRTVDPEFFGGAHVVTAGVRTDDGEVYEGVSLPASVGRSSMCAEPVAVGAAVADGHRHDEPDTCVAVSYPMDDHEATARHAVPPCGSCRELPVDCNETMRVLVPVDGNNRVVRATALLPSRIL